MKKKNDYGNKEMMTSGTRVKKKEKKSNCMEEVCLRLDWFLKEKTRYTYFKRVKLFF